MSQSGTPHPSTSAADARNTDVVDVAEASDAVGSARPEPSGGSGGGDSGRKARMLHSAPSRWMHWINFPLLAVMLWSGLRIYNANDVHALEVFGWRFDFFPQGVYDFFVADRRLAKGIAFHLVFGWLFVLNGVAYGIWLASSGEWRQIVPDRRNFSEAAGVVAHDLHLRADEPPHGKYNAAQRITYTVVIAMGAVMILTGFAIYKPVQLGFLTALLGGYEVARLIHFGTSVGFVIFFGIHILQVIRAGWGNFASMVSGYRLVEKGRGRKQIAETPSTETPGTGLRVTDTPVIEGQGTDTASPRPTSGSTEGPTGDGSRLSQGSEADDD